MAVGPAAFVKQADEDVAAVWEWIDEQSGRGNDEICLDCISGYIAAEIGDESHPRARELRRRFGL